MFAIRCSIAVWLELRWYRHGSAWRMIPIPQPRRRWVSSITTVREYTFPKPDTHDKIYIALSSGVDSSVAAKLLAETHPIENLYPIYMANWNPAETPDLINSAAAPNPRYPRNKPSLAHLLPDPPEPGTETKKCTTMEFGYVEDLCRFLGLREPRMINFEKEYWNEVFVSMVEAYERGDTPNPDVGCNRWVKFGVLMERLLEEEKREGKKGRKWWLATGHYAGIGYPKTKTTTSTSTSTSTSTPQSTTGKSTASPSPFSEPHLLRSRDRNKDQSFFLSQIHPIALSKLLFPLHIHSLTKPDVYALARKHALPGWAPGAPERAESMGLCFVEPTSSRGAGAAGFRRFLDEFLFPKPGNIVAGPELPLPEGGILEEQEGKPKKDGIGSPPRSKRRRRCASEKEVEEVDGKLVGVGVGGKTNFSTASVPVGTVLGTHQGLWTATIGEKAHLVLPQGDERYQGRWYVSRKDPIKNEIEVVRGWGNGRLWSYGMVVKEWHWLGSDCQQLVREILRELKTARKAKSDEGLLQEEERHPGESAANQNPTIWEQSLVIQFRHRQKPVRVIDVGIWEDQSNPQEKQPQHKQDSTRESSQKVTSGETRDKNTNSNMDGNTTDNGGEGLHVKILFESAQRAVTIGQSAAMWWGERCLGGGEICGIVDDRPDRMRDK